METSITALKRFWLYYKQKRAVNQKKRLNEITTGKTFSKNTGTQNIFKILIVFVFQKWYYISRDLCMCVLN